AGPPFVRTCDMLSRLLLAVLTLASLSAPCAAEPQAVFAAGSLSLYPARVRLVGPRQTQQLVVLGEGGGRQFDLTRVAKFASEDPTVATVDARGVVHPAGDGETTVTIQAGGHSAAVRVRVRQAAAD